MSDFRSKGRPSSSRVFRPALDGRLRPRLAVDPIACPVSWNRKGAAQEHLRQGGVPRQRAAVCEHAPRWNREFRTIPAAAFQTIRGGQP